MQAISPNQPSCRTCELLPYKQTLKPWTDPQGGERRPGGLANRISLQYLLLCPCLCPCPCPSPCCPRTHCPPTSVQTMKPCFFQGGGSESGQGKVKQRRWMRRVTLRIVQGFSTSGSVEAGGHSPSYGILPCTSIVFVQHSPDLDNDGEGWNGYQERHSGGVVVRDPDLVNDPVNQKHLKRSAASGKPSFLYFWSWFLLIQTCRYCM